MNLPGLECPSAHDCDRIADLARIMGESFLEENWTRSLLDALGSDTTPERKLFVSQEIMRLEFTEGASIPACYALPDNAACAGAYLRSDLGDRSWAAFEAAAWEHLARTSLTPEEAANLAAEEERIAAVSVFDWEDEAACGSDYIHFYALGVDRTRRGSGAFRRLVEPFFAFADEQGVPCFLETYSAQLESLYRHMGFETIRVIEDGRVDLVERCMVRRPHALTPR